MTSDNGRTVLSRAAAALPITVEARCGDEVFTWQVTDPDLLEVVHRYDSVRRGLEAVWTAGACALRAAGGGLELALAREQLQTATERLLATATSLASISDALAAEDGPLSAVLVRAGERIAGLVDEALRRQTDPGDPGSLAGQMSAARRAIGEVLQATRQEIVSEFGRTMAGHSQLVGQAIRGVRDLDGESALGRAIIGLGSELSDLKERLATRKGAEEAARAGSAKGDQFEATVARRLAVLANAAGDTIEHTGRSRGSSLRSLRPSNGGDIVITTPQGGAIVVECLDRRRQEVTPEALQRELERAMANRPRAVAAIAVSRSADNRVLCGWPFVVLRRDMFAVALDGDGLLPLQVAYRLARELALAAAEGSGRLDVALLQATAREIAAKLRRLQDVRELQATVGSCQRRSLEILAEVEGDVRQLVDRMLAAIVPPRS